MRFTLCDAEAVSLKEAAAKKLRFTISISFGNQKIGKVININQDPGLSCRPDAPCRGVCYACKGHYCFINVKKALQGNFWAYLHDPHGYFETIGKVVRKKEAAAMARGDKHPIVRWHSAGDIVDSRYFLGMLGVAQANPNVAFYAYTKQYEIVNAELAKGTKLPKNFHILFSHAQKGWESHIPNPYNLPTTYIDFRNKAMNEGAVYDKDAFHCPAVSRASEGALGHETGITCDECRKCAHAESGDKIVFYEH
jgi:hypothetical protein